MLHRINMQREIPKLLFNVNTKNELNAAKEVSGTKEKTGIQLTIDFSELTSVPYIIWTQWENGPRGLFLLHNMDPLHRI